MNDLIINGTGIKQRIISEINKAKQNIKIAMAEIKIIIIIVM